MFTLSHALQRLRQDLGDTHPATAEWTAEALERHLARALRDLSYHIPQQMKSTLQTVPGSRNLDVAGLTGRVRIAAVEWPVGQYPPHYRRWSLWRDTLTLLVDAAPAAAEDAQVYWQAQHALTPEGTTLPSHIEDLLLLGAAGYACGEAAARAVNQLNTGGPQVAQQYAGRANAALEEFRRELRHLGPGGSLRQTRLYVPAAPLPTQTSDPGPR